MSLTNVTDVRHTDPEFKVFYRISSDIDQWFSALATEAIRAQIIWKHITHSKEVCGLFVIGCWAVSFNLSTNQKMDSFKAVLSLWLSFSFNLRTRAREESTALRMTHDWSIWSIGKRRLKGHCHAIWQLYKKLKRCLHFNWIPKLMI